MIGHAYARTQLHMGINQIKVVVARAQIDRKIFERRKMVLQIKAGLPALYSATEAEGSAGVEIENLSVTAAVNKKAFQFAQPRQIHTGFKDVPMPQMHHITFGANSKSAA